MNFPTYDIKDGEPAGIQQKIWNGELAAYQRTLLNKLYKLQDPKKIQSAILELIKTTYHTEAEFKKAEFYKQEFDKMAHYLETMELLHKEEVTDIAVDEKGKENVYVVHTKQSIVKSIPQLRAKLA